MVRFQISQIGPDLDAKAFLKSLMREDQLQDVLYCTTGEQEISETSSHEVNGTNYHAGSLDEKFAKFRDNETRLEQWVSLSLRMAGEVVCLSLTRLFSVFFI